MKTHYAAYKDFLSALGYVIIKFNDYWNMFESEKALHSGKEPLFYNRRLGELLCNVEEELGK